MGVMFIFDILPADIWWVSWRYLVGVLEIFDGGPGDILSVLKIFDRCPGDI